MDQQLDEAKQFFKTLDMSCGRVRPRGHPLELQNGSKRPEDRIQTWGGWWGRNSGASRSIPDSDRCWILHGVCPDC